MNLVNGFFKSPNDIFDMGLNPYQLSVYLYITRCGNNSKAAYPSYGTIAKKCGMSRPKAIDTVAELEGMSLLNKELRVDAGKSQSNVYKAVEPSKRGLLPSQPHLPPSKQGLPNKEIDYKEPQDKEYINNTSISTKSTVRFLQSYESNHKESIEDTIATYYSYYQHYTNKEHPKLKEEQLERIYEVLENYIGDSRDFEEVIEQFFDTVKQTDYNLNHFATEGMLDILMERVK